MSNPEASKFVENILETYSQRKEVKGFQSLIKEVPDELFNEDIYPSPCANVRDYYDLGAQLGQGTFGSVCQATERKGMHRSVAIKEHIINEKQKPNNMNEFLLDRAVLEKSIREIQLLKRLDHPNIIELEGVYIDNDNHTYLVYPQIEYELRTLIQEKDTRRLSLPSLKSLIYQLLEGLLELEKNNILHRDLKPSNIMITANGIVKILDYGQSRYCDYINVDSQLPFTKEFYSLVQTLNDENVSAAFKEVMNGPHTPSLCTAWYRSPEMFFKTMNYDFKSDVYSMGMIIWEIMVCDGDIGFLFGHNNDDSIFKNMCEAYGLTLKRTDWLLGYAITKILSTQSSMLAWGPRNKEMKSFTTGSLNTAIPNFDELKLSPPPDDFNQDTNEELRFRQRINPYIEICFSTRGWTGYDVDKKNFQDLIEKMLRIDPTRRIDTLSAMNHPFFTEGFPIGSRLGSELYDLKSSGSSKLFVPPIPMPSDDAYTDNAALSKFTKKLEKSSGNFIFLDENK